MKPVVVLNRVKTNISHKVKPKTPNISRRSLRTQGKVPDSTGLKDQFRKQSKPDQILIAQLKNIDVHG